MSIVPIRVRYSGRIHVGNDGRRQTRPVHKVIGHDMVPMVLAALVEHVVDAPVEDHRGDVVDVLDGVNAAARIARDVPDDVVDGKKRM